MDPIDHTSHGPLDDPGVHAAAFDGLPADVGALCAVVQGLLLHDHYGGLLYGPPPAGFESHSRETLPVAQRLDAILARDPAGLAVLRTPFAREVGTCRDFALMLCAMLRHQGRPARVRCGFADYFGGGWEDHWVCEHWVVGDGGWALADAQLDAAHRGHLGIGFDIARVPRERFLTAPEAWQACRRGADPGAFGHGDARGLWLVEVNLVRDGLALAKRETSAWDDWRASPLECRRLDDDRLVRGDRLAERALAAAAPERPSGAACSWHPAPPWRQAPWEA